jgi:hypothetical protein
VVVAIIGSILLLQSPEPQITQKESQYVALNSVLKQKLAEHQIQMSSPIKLSNQDDIKQYCSFFTSEEKQQLVQYCTSTELKDSNNMFLGNIHMVGSIDEPKITLALIQTDNSTAHLDSVKIVFGIVSDSLVCDCWAQKKPGGLDSIGQWVDGLYEFHQSETKSHSKSNPVELEGKSLQLELSTNKDGYLWQFFIYS